MKDSEKLKALLSHYNLTTSGFAAKIGLSEEKVLNQILTGTYKISKAARLNGFNQEILCEFTQGGKIVRQVKRKYEMIASHTARRSFATNAYLAGIPIARIMMLTGHQSETSFFKYIKIQNTENAEELARHSFFSVE